MLLGRRLLLGIIVGSLVLGPIVRSPTPTACIKGYYEVEKCIENVVKSRNFISISDTLRKYKSIQTFLVMPFTIPRKLEFTYTFKAQKMLMKFILLPAFFIHFFTSQYPFMQAVPMDAEVPAKCILPLLEADTL